MSMVLALESPIRSFTKKYFFFLPIQPNFRKSTSKRFSTNPFNLEKWLADQIGPRFHVSGQRNTRDTPVTTIFS